MANNRVLEAANAPFQRDEISNCLTQKFRHEKLGREQIRICMTVARTCVHYQTTPIYGYGRPRELNPEEFHDCCNKLNNSIYTCATTSHFKAQSAMREET